MDRSENRETCFRAPYALARVVRVTKITRSLLTVFLCQNFANLASSSASNLAMTCRFEASVSLSTTSDSA
jgi:hypothetical protein